MASEARRLMDAGAPVEDVFFAEARERLQDGDRILERGFPSPGSEDVSTLYRHAHTLTGIAHALGFEDIETLSREVAECTRFYEVVRPGVAPGDEDLVRRDWRALHDAIDRFAHRGADTP